LLSGAYRGSLLACEEVFYYGRVDEVSS